MLIVYCVTYSFALIKGHSHSRLNLEGLMGILICGLTDLFILVYSYFLFGDINQSSLRFQGSWKRKIGTLTPSDKIIMEKFIRCSRPLQIDLGSFGYFKKPGSIRIIGRIVYYTVKYLLVMSKTFGI